MELNMLEQVVITIVLVLAAFLAGSSKRAALPLEPKPTESAGIASTSSGSKPTRAGIYEKASKTRTDIVYRFSKIPRSWNKAYLKTILDAQFKDSDFVVGSLAIEHHERSQTATVNCRQGTALPSDLILADLSGKYPNISLKADTDFDGLTTLYAPSPEEHLVESVHCSLDL